MILLSSSWHLADRVRIPETRVRGACKCRKSPFSEVEPVGRSVDGSKCPVNRSFWVVRRRADSPGVIASGAFRYFEAGSDRMIWRRRVLYSASVISPRCRSSSRSASSRRVAEERFSGSRSNADSSAVSSASSGLSIRIVRRTTLPLGRDARAGGLLEDGVAPGDGDGLPVDLRHSLGRDDAELHHVVADVRLGQPLVLAGLGDLPIRPREVDVQQVVLGVGDEAGEETAVEDAEALGAADVVDHDLLARVGLAQRLRQRGPRRRRAPRWEAPEPAARPSSPRCGRRCATGCGPVEPARWRSAGCTRGRSASPLFLWWRSTIRVEESS